MNTVTNEPIYGCMTVIDAFANDNAIISATGSAVVINPFIFSPKIADMTRTAKEAKKEFCNCEVYVGSSGGLL